MIEHFQRLGAHGVWADARLLAAVGSAAGDVTSVLRELAHVRGAQETWIARIEDRPAAMPVWPSMTSGTLAEAGATLDTTLLAILASLTPVGLTREISYTNTAGRAFRTPLADILLHLLTHGQYHRGKANAALRAIGAEAVNVDYVTWHREAAVAQR